MSDSDTTDPMARALAAGRSGRRLDGRTAIVTGAASGFGRAIAARFAAEGARVAMFDIDADTAEHAASVIRDAGGDADAHPCDVADAASLGTAVAAAMGALGRVDIAVNNAGFSHRNRPLMEVEEDEFDRCFAVNVKAIYHMTRALVPHWRERGEGGTMLNVSSTAGLRPRPGLTWYNASKGAANTLTKSLAAELAPDRVRVNALAPVMGATGMLETFMGMADTPENRRRFVDTVPLGRLSEPEDVANAALFLCSEEAAFLTGVVLEVDGGRCV